MFLQATGFITRVLCSLSLRTCSNEMNEFVGIGQTNLGGEGGSVSANQERENTIAQVI
jgi:hypothetical protein